MDEHDLVDGFCEWVKQDEARDIDSPELRDELARLFECVRTETEARVVEAAADIAAREGLRASHATADEWESLLRCPDRIREQVRALAPADYVAVRREDLEWLLEEAETCEVRMPTSNPTMKAKCAERFQRVRAALSRAGKGE